MTHADRTRNDKHDKNMALSMAYGIIAGLIISLVTPLSMGVGIIAGMIAGLIYYLLGSPGKAWIRDQFRE